MSYHQIFMVQGGMLEGDKEEGKRSEYKTPEFLGPTRVRLTTEGPESKTFSGDSLNEQLSRGKRAGPIY